MGHRGKHAIVSRGSVLACMQQKVMFDTNGPSSKRCRSSRAFKPLPFEIGDYQYLIFGSIVTECA